MSPDMARQVMSRKIANKQVRGVLRGIKVADDCGINYGCWTISSGELVYCLYMGISDLQHAWYYPWYEINTTII